MGANTFTVDAKGATARAAFESATRSARYERGHGGYTGTIAEKSDFVMIPLPDGVDPHTYANQLLGEGDPRVDNKWGPAGCIQVAPGDFLFFGWASS